MSLPSGRKGVSIAKTNLSRTKNINSIKGTSHLIQPFFELGSQVDHIVSVPCTYLFAGRERRAQRSTRYASECHWHRPPTGSVASTACNIWHSRAASWSFEERKQHPCSRFLHNELLRDAGAAVRTFLGFEIRLSMGVQRACNLGNDSITRLSRSLRGSKSKKVKIGRAHV